MYRAIAETPSPTLDEPLRRLSTLANNSKLWLGIAAALFVLGGRSGPPSGTHRLPRRSAINSAVVNLPMKFAEPSRASGPCGRRASRSSDGWTMPTSTSFPSGHSASAFAFASAIGGTLPGAAVPVRGLASAVAYSRVHTGVHYPGDVVVGSLIGVTIGEATALVARGISRRRASRRRPG